MALAIAPLHAKIKTQLVYQERSRSRASHGHLPILKAATREEPSGFGPTEVFVCLRAAPIGKAICNLNQVILT